jgi:hypothetical protein
MPRFPAITQMRATLCTRMHLGIVEMPVRCFVGWESWRPKISGWPRTMSLGDDPVRWLAGPQILDDKRAAVRLCRWTGVPSAATARSDLPVADAGFTHEPEGR